jgi:hypothetical protein
MEGIGPAGKGRQGTSRRRIQALPQIRCAWRESIGFGQWRRSLGGEAS